MFETKSDAHARGVPTQVWFVDIANCAELLRSWQDRARALDEATEARLDRIKNEAEHQTRFTVHCALRVLVEQVKGPNWRARPLTYSDQGQPKLPGLGLSLSLSHTIGAGLIALSPGPRVGVDIEPQDRHVKMRPERQQAIISAAEALSAAGNSPPTHLSFLPAWVRLEAYAKATGRGLAPLLTEVMAPFRQNSAPARELGATEQPNTLTVFDLNVAPNFVAAVALGETDPPPAVAHFPNTAHDLEAMLG